MQTYPLSMTWYKNPNVLPFGTCDSDDCYQYKFKTPPGFLSMIVTCDTKPKLWINNKAIICKEIERGKYRFENEEVLEYEAEALIVAPSWEFIITNYVKQGKNKISVIVYNTLANHYTTIPTRYKGNIVSGLIGPVTLYYKNDKEDI